MRSLLSRALVAFVAFVPASPLLSFQDEKASEEAAEEKGLTLERLFPEKSFFGPSARSMAFSHDGRFGAWLWRTYPERRHGSDLWVHDFQSGETTRVTSASILEVYQADTRNVTRDRREKAEARAKKDSEKKGEKTDAKDAGPDEDDDAEKNERDLGDVVGDDDAEDEDAPRYGGVSSFVWSPVAGELLFTSAGDIYRWTTEESEIERLTRTRESESRAQYLPDGSGFLFQRGGSLMRVIFGRHLVEQLDPELGDGARMSRFVLSSDGKKVAMVATKGDQSFMGGGRTVSIADYGDRFMKVREVPRHVSDDPLPKRTTIHYLYELPPPAHENGELYRVHSFEHTGPRDVVGSPDWSPDSTKITFATFRQQSSQAEVFVAELPEEESESADRGWGALIAKANGDESDNEDQGGKKGEKQKKEDEDNEDGDDDEAQDDSADESDDEITDLPARVVYRFLHQGGPTTPRMVEPHFLADSRRVAFLTEQSGFRHLGVLDPLYEHFEPVTRGAFEVYPEEMPEHRKWMYVTSTAEDHSCLDVYRVDFDEQGMKRLTAGKGRYDSVAVSPAGDRILANFQSYGRLNELVAVDVEKGEQADLTESHPDEARELTQAEPEFFSFDNRHGHEIQGLLFKPEGMKKDERRPLLIYVYGGPLGTRKEVLEGNFSSSAYFFARYMTEVHGYLTATIDPRGMSGYGALFEKANFEQVGKPQVEDLVDGARYLVEEHGADPEKIGLHGWSFGGFQTQMCLYTEPDVFACGIAGAGPTEWENYNSWYSTGTIGKSQTGTPDLEKYSLLPLAKNLEARLLLVHGMEDANVLYQDTVRVYAALLEAGKETLVELFLDPSGGHGLGGHVKRLGRYRKYEEFLVRNLGTVAED